MKMSPPSARLRTVWVCLAGCLLWAGAVLAQDPDSLAREADADLRKAQSLFFNGKRDEAVAMLMEGYAQVEALRQADPSDSRLASLEGKVRKLKGDLEKRLGQTLDLESGARTEAGKAPAAARPLPAKPVAPPMAASPAAAPSTSPAASSRLPYHAAQQMAEVDKQLQSINGPYSRFEYYIERGDFDAVVQALDGVDRKLEELPGLIETARKLAAEKGVGSHPDFDAAVARLEQEKVRSADMRRQIAQQAEASAAAGDAVSADVEALATTFDRLRRTVFERAYGGPVYYNDLEPVLELLQAITDFETKDLAAVRRQLSEFAGRYGETREAIEEKMHALGYSGNRHPGSLYEDLAAGIENVEKTRKAMGADLLRRAREDLDSLPSAHDFFRMERRERAREYSRVAAQFDPASAEIRTFIEALPARFDEDDRAFAARLDAREWPGSISGKKAEEQAGLEFFRKDADWGARPEGQEPRLPVAVAITGDWNVQKRDLLNRPVMHGVPALVAVEVPEEKKQLNVLRVYSVTLRTAEGPDVPAAPPFREITVGDSYYIRPGEVK